MTISKTTERPAAARAKPTDFSPAARVASLIGDAFFQASFGTMDGGTRQTVATSLNALGIETDGKDLKHSNEIGRGLHEYFTPSKSEGKSGAYQAALDKLSPAQRDRLFEIGVGDKSLKYPISGVDHGRFTSFVGRAEQLGKGGTGAGREAVLELFEALKKHDTYKEGFEAGGQYAVAGRDLTKATFKELAGIFREVAKAEQAQQLRNLVSQLPGIDLDKPATVSRAVLEYLSANMKS